MKRYERMTKEEILDTFLVNCPDCVLRGIKCREDTCELTKVCYLKEEIKTKIVHRYELIKSPEDLEKFRSDWMFMCGNNSDCDKCKYCHAANVSLGCFCAFLNEEIEVEDES